MDLSYFCRVLMAEELSPGPVSPRALPHYESIFSQVPGTLQMSVKCRDAGQIGP